MTVGRADRGNGSDRDAGIEVSLDAPPAWLVCRLSGPDPLGAILGLAGEWVERRPAMEPYYEHMVEAATLHGLGCLDRGSLLAGVRYDVDAAGHALPTIALLEIDALPTAGWGPAADLLGAIAEGAAVRRPEDEGPPLVDRVDTGCGPAVRAEYLRALPGTGRWRMGVEYWIPLDWAARALHLVFGHGNLAASAVLVDEYAAIVARLGARPAPASG